MQTMLLAVILKAGITIYFSMSSMQNYVQMHLQMLVGRLRPQHDVETRSNIDPIIEGSEVEAAKVLYHFDRPFTGCDA
jgi:hypothetical protein